MKRLGSVLRMLAMIGVAAFAGCTRKAEEPPQRPPVPVTGASASLKDVPIQLHAIGNVEAYATVQVRSQVTAELRKIHLQEGQEVLKGDLLFTLNPRPFENELDRTQANLGRDEAVLRQAEANEVRDSAQLKNAEIELQRYQRLVAQGIVSKQEYESRKTTVEAMQATVVANRAARDNAEKSIQATRTAIETARIQLGYCSIRAPVDGRTGTLLVNEGNLVKSADVVLLIINQVRPIYVNYAVPEQYLAEVKKRMATGKVPVAAEVNKGEPLPEKGNLTFVDNKVDSATGTIRLKATFANDGKQLWPGQFVNIIMTLSVRSSVVVVPSEAVQSGQGGQYVFVITKSMAAEARPVTTGPNLEGGTVIEKGLQAGEVVVTDGQSRLVPGARVQLKGGAEAAPRSRP